MTRVSHKSIAAKLGLNQSTVSRSLRNDPRIPWETRQRIQAVSKEMGYRPDSLLSELASARWRMEGVSRGRVIAYVVCTPADDNYVGLETNLLPHASSMGFQLKLFRRDDFASSARLERVLRDQGITDVLLGPVVEKAMMVELNWSKFIAVQLLPGFFRLPLHAVVHDHFNSVLLAWRKAVAYGYRRIGITLLNHAFPLMDDVIRSSAALACQRFLFPGLPAMPIFYFTRAAQRHDEFVGWVRKNRIDAVINFNSTHANLRPLCDPKMGFACLNTDERLEFSGVFADGEALAREGINLLLYCRRSNQWGIPKVRIDHVVEPQWKIGTTMLPRTAANLVAAKK